MQHDRMLVDENLSHHFAVGLNALQYPLGDDIKVMAMQDEFGPGSKDDEWILKWGTRKGFVLTQDVKMTTRLHEAALLKKYELGVFFLHPPKTFRYWDRVKLIVKHWQEIARIMKEKKRPFSYVITPRKVSKMR